MTAVKRVFISYAEEDQASVEALRKRLGSRGDITTWVMTESIDEGEEWFSEIAEGIAASDALLVLISSSMHRSRWVKKEILTAQERSPPLPVIPVRLDEEPVPKDLAFLLAGVQVRDAGTGPFESHLDQIEASVRRRLGLSLEAGAHSGAQAATGEPVVPTDVASGTGTATVPVPNRWETWRIVAAALTILAVAAFVLAASDIWPFGPSTGTVRVQLPPRVQREAVTVEVVPQSGETLRHVFGPMEVTWEFGGVPPGRVSVKASSTVPAGSTWTSRTFELAAGKSQEINVPPTSSWPRTGGGSDTGPRVRSGTVVVQARCPQGAKIVLTRPGSDPPWTQVQDVGNPGARIVFSEVPPGDYEVVARMGPRDGARKSVHVESGKDATVVVSLGE